MPSDDFRININQLQTFSTAKKNLDTIKEARNTLFVENGILQESKYPRARSFLSTFSKSIREQNAAAVRYVDNAMLLVYGAQKGRPGSFSAEIQDSAIIIQDLFLYRAKQEGLSDDMSINGNDVNILTNIYAHKLEENLYGYFEKYYQDNYSSYALLQKGPDYDFIKEGTFLSERDQANISRGVEFPGTIRSTIESGGDVLSELGKNAFFSRVLNRTSATPDGQHPLAAKAHIAMVLSRLDALEAYYPIGNPENQHNKEGAGTLGFLKNVVVIHEISRALSDNLKDTLYKKGSRTDVSLPSKSQAQFFIDIMASEGYGEEQTKLAFTLFEGNRLIERLHKADKTEDVEKLIFDLHSLAKSVGIPLNDFCTMQKLFYLSYASAYPADNEKKSIVHGDSFPDQPFYDSTAIADFWMYKDPQQLISSRAFLTSSHILFGDGSVEGNKVDPLDALTRTPYYNHGTVDIYDISRAILTKEYPLELRYPDAALREVAQTRLQNAKAIAERALQLEAEGIPPYQARVILQSERAG